jgi:cytochrome b
VSELQRYRVWDLPVRVFHWALVVLVTLQFLSGEFDLLPMQWHMRFGEITLALLLFRILWGVVGSDNARFARFLHSPRVVAAYLGEATRRSSGNLPGHNPLGGWSITLMLAVLVLQTATGLFSSDDIDEFGPLAGKASDAAVKWLTRIHHLGRWVLLGLIVLHLAGVIWHRIHKREDLIGPMFSGRKQLSADPRLRFASTTRALLLAALSAGAIWVLVQL